MNEHDLIAWMLGGSSGGVLATLGALKLREMFAGRNGRTNGFDSNAKAALYETRDGVKLLAERMEAAASDLRRASDALVRLEVRLEERNKS